MPPSQVSPFVQARRVNQPAAGPTGHGGILAATQRQQVTDRDDLHIMKTRLGMLLVLVSVACAAGYASPAQPSAAESPARIQHARPELPGQKPDGSILLPNQWSLRPAGKQIPLGDLPVNIAVHPSGKFAAVLHCGYGPHEIAIVDLSRNRITSRVEIEEGFYGLAYSPDGNRLYCSGSSEEVLHSFKTETGLLADHQTLRLRPIEDRGVPAGIAITPDGQSLWVANLWGHRISRLDLATGKCSDMPTFGKVAPAKLTTPSQDFDIAAAEKRGLAAMDPTSPSDAFPYTCVYDQLHQRVYVSLWAQARVAVVNPTDGTVTALWSVEDHPNEMQLTTDAKRLFVANANLNTVTVLDTTSGAAIETLTTSLDPNSPPGSTPNSLAISPDGTLLFAANACNNTVCVFDISRPGASQPLGFIPTGWYPTCIRVTPDGKSLLIANGKGLLPRSNRHGPAPGRLDPPASVREYIGRLLTGTLGVVDLGSREKFLDRLRTWSEAAKKGAPRQGTEAAESRPKKSPIPDRVGSASPIRYCIFIIKENRTYDQVLGDLPGANGAPELCLFPETVTPNQHALAREFVTLDNFYVESEVSADGHEWTVGAYATDFVEKTWPLNYGHNPKGKIPYPSEGRFGLARPAGGYLWDRAKEAGLTYRSYGEFVENATSPDAPATTRVPGLVDHIDPGYRAWDMTYPDVKRAQRFISELKRFEKEGDMPRLQIMRLPNNHTYGTATGRPTPRVMVAENDLALGMVIEAVSHSKFWPRTAVFVVEDDAQNGSDHVDAHRSTAFVLSPYVRRSRIDSTMYSTCSILRTMGLILGMKPLSQFDANARPLYSVFGAQPNLKPYKALPARVDLQEKNTPAMYGATESNLMNFAKEDAADDLRLNEVIWRSVRGANSPMPPPVRAAFLFGLNAVDDDD